MPNFAVVIGINDYANEEWNLGAAVADALEFARWALDRASVDRANLRLLLSGDANTDLPYDPADAEHIFATIADLQDGLAAGTDRLFFYYAGHGASVPGLTEGGDPDPVLLPADVRRLRAQQHLFVRFSQIMPALVACEPREQFFFIDACRDFALEGYVAGVGGGGRWAPPDDAESEAERTTSVQYVLYAVSPGERAQEQKALQQGVFGAKLLEGLRGEPEATSFYGGSYKVSFERLARFVEERTAEAIKKALPRDWARYLQVPQKVTRATHDPVLATIPMDDMKRVPVTLRVTPSAARDTCELRIVYDTPGGQEVTDGGLTVPPIGLTVNMAVRPFNYRLEAVAANFERYAEDLPLWRECVRDLKLAAATQAAPAGEPAHGPATVTVTCPDPSAEIVVYDNGRRVLARGHRRVTLANADPGLYTAKLTSAEGDVSEQHFNVLSGRAERVVLRAPGPSLGPEQAAVLKQAGIEPDKNGFIRLGPGIEPLASARLSTLLAYSALAVQLPGRPGLEPLRKLGVEALTEVAPGGSGLLTILARSGEARPGEDSAELARSCELIVRDTDGAEVAQMRLEPLPGMTWAGQAGLTLKAGCVTAELRIPGLEATRYALTALPDRVTVLIAVGEPSGAIEVEQYILPPRDGKQGGYNPRQIRALDLATRHYERREPLGDENMRDLLAGKWLDPLLGALAGYALIRAGDAKRYVGTPREGKRKQQSAMKNMLNFFPGLPDSHVLAALCEPERRDEHFGRALALGLPVFADGFRALYDWYHEQERKGRPLWMERSALLSGSIWTAWAAERPAIRVENGSFGEPPPGWGVLEDVRATLEQALPAVGALRVAEATFPLRTTAFAVAPGLVVTMEYAWPHEPPPDGEEALAVEIDFGAGPEPSGRRFPVIERVAVTDFTSTAFGKSSAFVVLRTAERAVDGSPFPTPLRLAARPPDAIEGRRVAVIGFPGQDGRIPPYLRERVFGGTFWVKRIQPGRALTLAEEGTVLRHDCMTAGGNGGSPVLDLETGEVLALHYAGLWAEYKRGDALPLWPSRDQPAPATLQAALRAI
jgi:hypothetical protein